MKEQTVLDEQTGKSYKLVPEGGWDIFAAIVSILYLVAMLLFFSFLLALLAGQSFQEEELNYVVYLLILYAVIGGGLGGVVNGIRSFLAWHAEREAFGRRYLWKYITLPLLGAVLAAIVYALIRSGIVAVGGNFATGDNFTHQALAAFAIGALSGYGSHKVFKWLDGHVNRLFKIGTTIGVTVPDLKGKTQSEAEVALKKCNLNLGNVSQKVGDDPAEVDKVVGQNPPAGAISSKGGTVDITIAIKA
jgi:hypothetical protein